MPDDKTQKKGMGKHGFAICDICKKEMIPNNSGCWSTLINSAGEEFERIPYGGQGEDTSMPCGDCNVKPYKYHHFGCDNETCPACGDQLLGCECDWVEIKK